MVSISSRKSLFLLVFVTCLLGLSISVTSAQETASAVRTSLILADIDDNPVKAIGKIQPLADYLAARLTAYGIESGEVKIAPDMETMIAWMEDGEVDILFDSPYPAMVMVTEANAIPVLRRWKDGVGFYHTVFFALAERGLASVEDLNGTLVGFDAPQSTSGYMLPKSYLLDLGLNPVEVDSLRAAVASDEIGYIFTEDDETTVQWVISGRVAAGVVDNVTFEEIPAAAREQMVILGETVEVPRHVMVARPDMDPELVQAVSDLLVVAHEDEEAAAALEAFETTRFDFFPEGAQAALDNLKAMFEAVQ